MTYTQLQWLQHRSGTSFVLTISQLIPLVRTEDVADKLTISDAANILEAYLIINAYSSAYYKECVPMPSNIGVVMELLRSNGLRLDNPENLLREIRRVKHQSTLPTSEKEIAKALIKTGGPILKCLQG